jgi:hypothetical protein
MTTTQFPTAALGDQAIQWQSLCTHWTGWGKAYCDLISCRLEMPLTYVVERFGRYWADFISRESEDDGTTPPDGAYANLAALGYPTIETMLASHFSLFSELVMDGMQPEFAGFLLREPSEVAEGGPCYFLQGINSLEFIDKSVILIGSCFKFPKQ